MLCSSSHIRDGGGRPGEAPSSEISSTRRRHPTRRRDDGARGERLEWKRWGALGTDWLTEALQSANAGAPVRREQRLPGGRSQPRASMYINDSLPTGLLSQGAGGSPGQGDVVVVFLAAIR